MPAVELERAFDRIVELEFDPVVEELEDLLLVVARNLTEEGKLVELDDVLATFGYTREQLKALPDSDES